MKKRYLNQGKLCKEKRIIAGLTQEFIAHELGYKCMQSINNVERGLQGIPLKKLNEFLDIINCSISEFETACMKDTKDMIREYYKPFGLMG